jgi:hypothetical protein
MDKRERFLKYYLYVFGFLNVFVVSTVPFSLGDRVLWQPRNLPDELMIAGIYVAMGVCMIAAAPNPKKHKAFVDFVILANLVHAAIMAAAARNVLQIVVDVVPIAAMGMLPLAAYPWGIKNYLRGFR